MVKDIRLVKRNLVGLWIGIWIGIIFFILVPDVPSTHLHLRLAFIIWYATFGGFIGMVGVFDKIQLYDLWLPWWLRGLCVGACLNFIVLHLAYEEIGLLIENIAVKTGSLVPVYPWYFVLVGAVLGLLIDGILTKLYWDGPLLFKADK